jgi:protoheme IX farnesyltransferase
MHHRTTTFVDTQRLAPGDFVALTKPRLNLLVVATSAAGYYLGEPGPLNAVKMIETVIGTALVASGAAVLNQVYERDTDRLMRRTRTRPLPDGRVSVREARVFGVLLSALGLGLLAATSNLLATFLALVTLVVYVIIYTPMKRWSSLSTLVGAIPGALPPLIGWAAASGSLALAGWSLFGIVFLWQIPHFLAIAWMYRDDYRNAGFPMLPVIEADGRRTGQQALLYAIALIPMSLLPAYLGLAGWLYFFTSLALGFAMLGLAARFAMARSDGSARALFFGSITYLPLLWLAMIVDHPLRASLAAL